MLEGSKVDPLTTRKAASFISSVLRFAIEPMCARSADHSNGIEIQTVPLDAEASCSSAEPGRAAECHAHLAGKRRLKTAPGGTRAQAAERPI